MTLTVFLVLIWLHFIADFLLQTDNMALNKSTSNKWLSIHITVYMIPFMIVMPFFIRDPVAFVAFIVLNWILHFMTDYFSSRMTSYLWKNEQRHWFFVTIGFDQALHFTALVTTYAILV